MMGEFVRTLGPGADVKEMEYINALQQTCLPELRRNCTLSSNDIRLYLQSRFGLNVSNGIIKTNIIQQLGGQEDYQKYIKQGSSEEEDEEEEADTERPTSPSNTQSESCGNKEKAKDEGSTGGVSDRRKGMTRLSNSAQHIGNNRSTRSGLGGGTSTRTSQRDLLLQKAQAMSMPNIASSSRFLGEQNSHSSNKSKNGKTTLTTLPLTGTQVHLPNAVHRYINKKYYHNNNSNTIDNENDEDDDVVNDNEGDKDEKEEDCTSSNGYRTTNSVIPKGNDDEQESNNLNDEDVDDVVENPTKKQKKKKEKKKKEPFVEEYLDLAQIMSILFIPSLLRSAYDLLGKERLRGRHFASSHSSTHFQGTNASPEEAKDVLQDNSDDDVQLPPTLMRDMVRWIIWGLEDNAKGNNSEMDHRDGNPNVDDDEHERRSGRPLEMYVTNRHIKQLLHLCGEHDRASNDNDELVTQMLRCLALRAPGSSGSRKSKEEGSVNDDDEEEWYVLNEVTLAYALTSDVALWDADWDKRFSTYYYDVFYCVIGNRPLDRIMKQAMAATSFVKNKNEGSEVEPSQMNDDAMPDTVLIAQLYKEHLLAQERLLAYQGNKVRMDSTDFQVAKIVAEEKERLKKNKKTQKKENGSTTTSKADAGHEENKVHSTSTHLLAGGGSSTVNEQQLGECNSKRMLSVISEGENEDGGSFVTSHGSDHPASNSFRKLIEEEAAVYASTTENTTTNTTKLQPTSSSKSSLAKTSDDSFPSCSSPPEQQQQQHVIINSDPSSNNKSKKWKFSQTLYTGAIDFVTDTQWSPIYLVMAWLVFVMSVAVYGILVQAAQVGQIQCRNPKTFGCTLGRTVVAWLVTAVIFMLAGLLVFLPLSLGNSAFRRRFKQSIVSLIFASVICIPPFVVTVRYWYHRPDGNSDQPRETPTEYDTAMDQFFFAVSLFIAFTCGVLLIICMITQIGVSATYLKWGDRGKRFINWWTSTNDAQASYHGKLAATHKLNQMISNAHLLHFVSINSSPSSNFNNNGNKEDTYEKHAHGQVMLNYNLWGEADEYIGGLIWTWKRIWDRSLFKREGYWIHSRLYIAQCIQFVSAIFYSYFMIGAARVLSERAQGWRNTIESYQYNVTIGNNSTLIDSERFPNLGNAINDRYSNNNGTATNYGDEPLPQWVFDIVPEPWMIRRSLYSAAGVAMLIMICLMLVYLPTTASTVLKLRCGVLPSMKDPHFMKYRLSADTVAYNLGNIFFALIGSATMFYGLFGIVIFASIWPFTKPITTLLYAWLIGLFITIFAKVALMICFRSNFHCAFYRSNPNGANITGLMLECWHIGVAGGVLVSRLTQFLLATAFWIGRIDVPFLADDVRIFGYRFDNTPSNYRKDILVHEAHRHPYIERLGAMYLMKLKYGDRFGHRANACWRNIFVLMLMPWYAKYRVSHRSSITTNTSEKEQQYHDVVATSGSIVMGDGETKINDDYDYDDEEDKSFRDSLTALDKLTEGLSDGLTAVAMEIIDEWPTNQTTRENHQQLR